MHKITVKSVMKNAIFSVALGIIITPANDVLAQNILAPFSKASTSKVPEPWRVVGIPKGKVPLAQFDIVALDGGKVLRLKTEKSYGNLVHDILKLTSSNGGILKWRWRLDEPVANANLRVKAGDDAALKVCLMFDMPTEGLPFADRALLGLARSISGERLPAATLCYVWDINLPAGTLIDNAYTKRVKFWVLDGKGSETELSTWKSHERNIAQDFIKAFGAESKVVPAIEAIVVGADSDNTGGSSLAFVGDISWNP